MTGHRLIAYTHARDDPAARFRLRQYVPRFERAGWSVSHRPCRPERPWASPFSVAPLRWIHQRAGVASRRWRRRRDIADAAGYDAAFVNRDLLEGRIENEAALIRRNPRVLFDFDDAIHVGAKERHFAWICEHAAWVSAGNESLARAARRYTDRVSVIATAVETSAYPPPPPPREDTVLRVGWLGSDLSIRETLFRHTAMIAELQRALNFEMVVVSRPWREPPPPRPAIRFVEWSPSVETRIAELFDVGIMPLVDDELQRGKCGCKLLQYMAAGLPVIASPVGVNRSLVAPGRGILARHRDDWGEALTRLADPQRRCTLGTAGRRYVEREYSTDVWFPRLLGVVDAVRTGSRPPPGDPVVSAGSGG